MTNKGRLIVFEGPDGVGKTTLAKKVAQRLRSVGGPSVLELAFPSGADDSLGQVIYDIHHHPERFGLKGMDRTSLQVLHVAAHIDTIEKWIRPHLQEGGWVVLDRYWWSTWVYGMANDVPRESLMAMIDLERIHWKNLTPDLLIVMDRRTPFRSESDAVYYGELRRLYACLEQDEKGQIPVCKLTNEGTVSEAIDECMRLMTSLCEDGQPLHLEES